MDNGGKSVKIKQKSGDKIMEENKNPCSFLEKNEKKGPYCRIFMTSSNMACDTQDRNFGSFKNV